MAVGSIDSGLEAGTNDWLQEQLDRKQRIIIPVHFGLIGTFYASTKTGVIHCFSDRTRLHEPVNGLW